MPKTTVHKDHELVPWENNVWLAWEVFPVKSEAVAEGMEGLPNPNFRAGIGWFIGLHYFSAIFGGHFSPAFRLGNSLL